jgi:hypothetical protein
VSTQPRSRLSRTVVWHGSAPVVLPSVPRATLRRAVGTCNAGCRSIAMQLATDFDNTRRDNMFRTCSVCGTQFRRDTRALRSRASRIVVVNRRDRPPWRMSGQFCRGKIPPQYLRRIVKRATSRPDLKGGKEMTPYPPTTSLPRPSLCVALSQQLAFGPLAPLLA